MEGTVILDPGHGGASNNAVSFSGVLEKDIALRLGLLVRDALAGSGVRVVMTRDADVNVGLGQRARLARKHRAALFLSLHCNGFDGKTRGTETLIRSPDSRPFAERVQAAVVAAIRERDTGAIDRGVKTEKLEVLSPFWLGSRPACLLEVEFIVASVPEEVPFPAAVV
ncbi:MAG: N-acetylmuramoyl-L-alanine amidase [Candidatus Solibacter usitatus]|nr:N-acetylmuramoyl-L-alanine amidase [Candidatus Solibacter usitatus]